MTIPPNWRALNQANWDERVPIHLAAPLHYDLTRLRAGTERLDPIAEARLGPVKGLSVLHLQCHFGKDTLTLARQGATVTGLDFSQPAIDAANHLAAELGLADRATFIRADVYDAATAIPAAAQFDRVFVSWGALCWLPDVFAWAGVVASCLKPGGYLAFADAHPAAYVFDSANATPDGRPGWYTPYLGRAGIEENRSDDYADPAAILRNSRTIEFLHPISDILTALIQAGLRIDQFLEHDSIVWRMFTNLVERAPNEHAWPDHPWLPLSFSLRASKA